MTEQTPNEPQSETVHSGEVAVVEPPRSIPALVAHDDVMAIMPRNLEEASRYATGLCRAGIVPDAFRIGGKKANEPDQPLVLMGVLKSLEIGVPPQTGLAGLLPLNGRFSVWGDLAAALVQRTGLVTDQQTLELGGSFDPALPLGEWPPEYGFKVMYWRKGQDSPYVGQFTVRDAKRANLWMNSMKQPWMLYPRRMLFNRARALALRDGFSDGLAGLTIAEEAMDHAPPVDERGPSKRMAALLDTEAGDEPA